MAAAGASGGDGPKLPFHDEETFKAWMSAGNKNSKKATAVDDFAEPTKEELDLMASVRPLLSKENQSVDDQSLNRFIRGYGMLHFREAEDRVERTAIITNLALDWMRDIDFVNLPDKTLPKREEWSRIWPTCVSGLTDDKRLVWFATAPGDIKKYTLEEVGLFHAQDLACLHRAKRENAEREKRQWTGLHHMVIIDAGWADGPGIDRGLLKYIKQALIHKSGANTTQHFQPDALSRAFVVNVSFVYRALFSFAKLFMEATTAAKYNLFGSDYLSALAEAGIPREAIPMYLGGVAPNPHGLRQNLKVERGHKEVLTCVIGSWRDVDTFDWRASFPKGVECNITIELGDKTVSGKGAAQLPIGPGSNDKVVITFHNETGHSVHVDFWASVIKVNAAATPDSDAAAAPAADGNAAPAAAE